MIFYTRGTRKIQCRRCGMPLASNTHTFVDNIEGFIDGRKTCFWFFLKTNASYLYFEHKSQWYKTQMVCEDGFDLLTWLRRHDPHLFTYTDIGTKVIRLTITDKNTMLPSINFITECLRVHGINAVVEDITDDAEGGTGQ